MAFKYCILLSLVAVVAAQNSYRVCVSQSAQCQSLELGDSRAVCIQVESRVDCALRLARGTADIGYFTDEELLVLSAVQSSDHRVVASIRDNTKILDAASFEAVVVVPNTHTNGLQGLSQGRYCHPGLGEATFRWSPRVDKQLELVAAETDRCPDADHRDKTAEEMEVAKLSAFFGDSCRPGAWTVNATLDAELKSKYPSLCALCGPSARCEYSIDMGVGVAGVNNNNAHIRALECLRSNGTVAYAAWQHVREFFSIRNPDAAASYSVLCTNGSLVQLSATVLGASAAPCAFVRQPWSAIVATTSRAAEIQSNLAEWWPNQVNPNDGTWKSTLFSVLVPASSTSRVSFENPLQAPANYTAALRSVPHIDSASTCVPVRRWCTISAAEQQKCTWLRNAAYTLGIQPALACTQRNTVFDCLRSVRDGDADFLSTPSNYGYIARQYFKLTPVKLVQNQRSNADSFSRVIALLKNNTTQSEITRFENMKGKRACFPEFGGISYVSFVGAARDNRVLSATECDYAQVVGEFFGGACAPGAMDAAHAISETNYDATPLCSSCRSTNTSTTFTCDWNYAYNEYFGNNGSMSCLSRNDADVAFVETQNLEAIMRSMGLDANQYRVLCRNNSLALTPGINVDDGCLLAFVVDSEVLTRRGSFERPTPPVKPHNDSNKPPPPLRPKYVNDPAYNSLAVLLDTLEKYFGYAASSGTQHVNLEIFSAFDGTNDLLFKNTAVGFSEPTSTSSNEQARNYIELFKHLQGCTGAGSNIPVPGLANRSFYSMLTLVLSAILTKFIVI